MEAPYLGEINLFAIYQVLWLGLLRIYNIILKLQLQTLMGLYFFMLLAPWSLGISVNQPKFSL
jgi:hypothetical protein